MAWFIKTEIFTDETLQLSVSKRKFYLNKHKSWIQALTDSGINVKSGFLVDQNGRPGGGGLLILEAHSFKEAKSLINKDPLIKAGLVHWTLQEWIPVNKTLNE